MTITEAIDCVHALEKNRIGGDCEIRGLSDDSRQVQPGFVFFAVTGTNTDGHRFLQEAIERGAVLAVIQQTDAIPVVQDRISFVLVSDVRLAMARISSGFYGNPSRRIHVVGVTGTNGKTTTCFFLNNVFEEGGLPCGLLTTVKNVIGNDEYESINTTEDSLRINSRFAALLEKGIRYAVMEVSSHGLALGRVEGILFDTAVVTNLVPEHLEFHGDYTHYFQSKKKLLYMVEQNLETMTPRVIVINGDDPEVIRMAEGSTVPVISFGIDQPTDVRAENARHDIDRSEFIIMSPWGKFTLQIGQPGIHNVYNALGAATVALYYGITPEVVARGLAQTPRIPGRWERVHCGQPFEVIVDFAHNWHGLEKSLSLIRSLTGGNIITVFGCGGERDTQKRPLMGEVAARWSDLCIFTADNPRHEDPMSTIHGALVGVQKVAQVKKVEYRVVVDRKEAIRQALYAAGKGDVVFLAGKGPERSQIYAEYSIPHNDFTVARTIIKEEINATQA